MRPGRLYAPIDRNRCVEIAYCRSYSPLPTRLSTLKPAFLASEIESDRGELKVENTLCTGFLHAGH